MINEDNDDEFISQEFLRLMTLKATLDTLKELLNDCKPPGKPCVLCQKPDCWINCSRTRAERAIAFLEGK